MPVFLMFVSNNNSDALFEQITNSVSEDGEQRVSEYGRKAEQHKGLRVWFFILIKVEYLQQRQPDALILGVKKCGTMTLGQNVCIFFNLVIFNFFEDTFLSKHPNIVARGEISFFIKEYKESSIS